MFKKEITLKIDTETAPLYPSAPFKTPLVYDFGYEVFDRQGNTLEKGHYVILETFKDKKLMTSAYYYNKFDKYIVDMCGGKIKAMSVYELPKLIERLVMTYKVTTVSAYNLQFDLRALAKTFEYFKVDSDWHEFPCLKRLDTLKFARQAIAKQKKYIAFCEENGYMSKPNKNTGKQFPLTNAEVMYRFVANDLTFVEEHMGLPDVEIEKEIMFHCLKKKTPIPYQKPFEQVALEI